jgi:hypothetical protein
MNCATVKITRAQIKTHFTYVNSERHHLDFQRLQNDSAHKQENLSVQK